MSLIQLNETQQEIQSLARAYAQRELVALAGERDQESRFDRVMVTQMAELGFFGMLTPHFVYEPFITAPQKQMLAIVAGGLAGHGPRRAAISTRRCFWSIRRRRAWRRSWVLSPESR